MNVLLTILVLCMIYAIYILKRNEKVCDFRVSIIKLCCEFNRKEIEKIGSISEYLVDDAYGWCYDKLPSYKKMLFSLKKLKLENWMSKETIKKLKS